ncbi:hypothetical protein LINPERHAP2_LOCUS401 [Linum perenne]
MIINTLGKNFPYVFMSRKIPQLWARKGGVEIFDIGWGFYVIRFESVADQERAMFGGPWMIGDYYVVLQSWRPYFRPEASNLSTLRVWVRLPGLPIEYFDAAILRTIGDKIGTTVRIDHTTLTGNRGNFARICVEVDLAKPLLSKYKLRHRVRRIEYEGLHIVCYSCCCYGHKQESCTVFQAPENTVNADDTFVNPIFCQDGESVDRPEVLEDYGPWMLVKRGNRRSKNIPAAKSDTGAEGSPAVNAEKGNRPGAFKAVPEKEVEIREEPADSAPRTDQAAAPAIEKAKDTENVDPNQGMPNGHGVLANHSLGNGPVTKPSAQNPPMGLLDGAVANDGNKGGAAEPISQPATTRPVPSSKAKSIGGFCFWKI